MKFGLTGNPFEMKTVHDINDFEIQPFLLLKSQRILKTKLEFNLTSGFPIYQIIIGDRGIGKSSTLLYLYKFLNEGNKAEVCYSNRPIIELKNIADLIGLYNPINQKEGVLKMIKNYLEDKKLYLFLDMPDKVTSEILRDFLGVLETLLDLKKISVFIAMNRSHYDRSFSHSEILGKYTSIELEPFEFEETEQMVIERLKISRESNGLKPFTEESLRKIHSFSSGIPRNILSACDLLLMGAVEENIEIIDVTFTSKKLQSEFAYKIINERIKDITNRENLKRIYDFIKIKFKGNVKQEKEFQKEYTEINGGASMTLRKRIRTLEKLGLIELRKNPEDMWSNQIIIKG